MSKKILVIDDDEDILELLIYNLEKADFKVESARNGEEGIEKARVFMPDLILMDIMMPVLDGIKAGKIIKSDATLKHIQLVYLTARTEEYTEVLAFDLGADDYISKPIKPVALISRINTYFRKEEAIKANLNETNIQIAGLQINKENYTVTKADGTVIILPKKEFEILYFLACSPNKVQSRDTLLHNIWGEDIFVVERTIDVHIRKVREKIGDEHIHTIKGVGYMFKTEI